MDPDHIKVRQICFSSNERFVLLIGDTQCSIIEIDHNESRLVKQLPLVFRYRGDLEVEDLQWTGAVSNSGEYAAVYCQQDFDTQAMETTIGRTAYVDMHVGDKCYKSNIVWVWNSHSKKHGSAFQKVELGIFVPNEIFEISFEPQDANQRHFRLKQVEDEAAAPLLTSRSNQEVQ